MSLVRDELRFVRAKKGRHLPTFFLLTKPQTQRSRHKGRASHHASQAVVGCDAWCDALTVARQSEAVRLSFRPPSVARGAVVVCNRNYADLIDPTSRKSVSIYRHFCCFSTSLNRHDPHARELFAGYALCCQRCQRHPSSLLLGKGNPGPDVLQYLPRSW